MAELLKYKLVITCVMVLILGLTGVLPPFLAVAGSEPDHGMWDELLRQYNHQGQVDYAGFKREEARLNAYLDTLAKVDPRALARDEQFAFYVNAYNAWTVKLILTGYPGVASIKDLGSLFKSPWKKKFVDIDGELRTLDHIEHAILRPRFKDPRVHFAINCASKSCPVLYPEAFTGTRLQTQLDDASRQFVNDSRFNRLDGKTLYVSSIFKWFNEDFNGDVVGFLEQYAAPGLKAAITADRKNIEVKYLDYDWSLNGK